MAAMSVTCSTVWKSGDFATYSVVRYPWQQHIIGNNDRAFLQEATALQYQQILQVDCLLVVNQDVVKCADAACMQPLQTSSSDVMLLCMAEQLSEQQGSAQ